MGGWEGGERGREGERGKQRSEKPTPGADKSKSIPNWLIGKFRIEVNWPP